MLWKIDRGSRKVGGALHKGTQGSFLHLFIYSFTLVLCVGVSLVKGRHVHFLRFHFLKPLSFFAPITQPPPFAPPSQRPSFPLVPVPSHPPSPPLLPLPPPLLTTILINTITTLITSTTTTKLPHPPRLTFSPLQSPCSPQWRWPLLLPSHLHPHPHHHLEVAVHETTCWQCADAPHTPDRIRLDPKTSAACLFRLMWDPRTPHPLPLCHQGNIQKRQGWGSSVLTVTQTWWHQTAGLLSQRLRTSWHWDMATWSSSGTSRRK